MCIASSPITQHVRFRSDQGPSWLSTGVRSDACLAGKGHVLADGRRIPYSLVNNTAPGFDAPSVYSPADFPFSGPWHPERIPFQPNVAHFMSLCMKLVYEQSDAIEVCPT